jgi:hypothetical protein
MKRTLIIVWILICLALVPCLANEMQEAVRANDAAKVRELIAAGADLAALNDILDPPLNQAVIENRPEIVRILVEAGADVNGANPMGDTPLHQAARYDRPELVRYLLDQKADFNARNKSNETPRDLAAFYKNKPILKMLDEAFNQWYATVNALEEARKKNSRKAYELVAQKYPASDAGKEARRWLDDPVYAFIETFRFDLPVRGFIESHPESALHPVAEVYLEFAQGISKKSLSELQKIQRRHPDNPFAQAAPNLVPTVWLKAAGEPVGVRIQLGNIVFKGLVGGPATAEKVRQKLWKRINEPLAAAGIQAVLLPDQAAAGQTLVVSYVLEVNYSEKQLPSYPRGSSFADSAAENLAALIYSPSESYLLMNVVRVQDGTPVFRGFRDVNQMAHYLGPDLFQGQAVSPSVRLAGVTLSLGPWAALKSAEKDRRVEETRRTIVECLAAAGQK